MEGSGFNASIYADGKKVLDLIDEGNGGALHVYAIGEEGRRVEKELKALCATLPKDKAYGIEIDVDADIYLDELVNEAQFQAKLARLRKKATPFVLPGEDPSVGYRTINTPDVEKAKAFLDKKFPSGYTLI
jgi:hypothetical protein